MLDEFRQLQEKAIVFAGGNQELSESVYNSLLTDVAKLDDLVAKSILIEALLASTAFLTLLGRVTGHDPLHILDNLSIIEGDNQ